MAFYRDRLGLPEIIRFTGHAGQDGVMLDLPGTATHLEVTATAHMDPPHPHAEDLLVLYLGDRPTLTVTPRAAHSAHRSPAADRMPVRTGRRPPGC